MTLLIALPGQLEIKAKLYELTGEHEEELPDYIMVMVANQRSRYQMQDELNLFLADQTEEFVDWLHSKALKRLGEDGSLKSEKGAKSESRHHDKRRDSRSKGDSNKNANQEEYKPEPRQATTAKSPSVVQAVQSMNKSTPPRSGQERQAQAAQSVQAAPPSPVIIIKRQTQQQSPANDDEETEKLRQQVVATRRPSANNTSRVSSTSLPSTVARVITRDCDEPMDEEDDYEEPAVSSVIQVKQREFIATERQASKRLFLQVSLQWLNVN